MLAIALIGIVVATATLLVIWNERRSDLEIWKTRLQTHAAVISAFSSQAQMAADLVLDSVSERIQRAHVGTEEELRSYAARQDVFDELSARASSLPQVDVLTIAARDGTVLSFSRSYPVPPINLVDRDYFQAHLNDPGLDSFLSQPVQNRGNGTWTFYVAKKIKSPDGDMLGLMLVGIKVDFFIDYFSRVTDGPGVATTLLRSDGIVLARYPVAAIGSSLKNAVAFMAASGLPQSVIHTDMARSTDPSDHSKRLIVAQRVKGLPLLVVASATDEVIFAAWSEFALTSALISLGVYALSVLLVFQLKRSQQERERNAARIQELNGELITLNKSLERKVQERTKALENANKSLRKMASTDSLTGLPNRRTFDQRLKNDIAIFERYGTPFTLLLIDLDHFKTINDTNGHDCGDMVLRNIGELLNRQIRQSDLAARLGGEEFAILLSRAAPSDIGEFADRLIETIRELDNMCGIRVTATIGIATVRVGDNPATLYKRADQALYSGKEDGRDRVVMENDLMPDASAEKETSSA